MPMAPTTSALQDVLLVSDEPESSFVLLVLCFWDGDAERLHSVFVGKLIGIEDGGLRIRGGKVLGRSDKIGKLGDQSI